MGNNNNRGSQRDFCIYCNALVENGTREHTPPKCCFPKGTEGLITVPACYKCNNASAKDDEYFRDMIVMSKECSGHPQAKEPLGKVLRNLDRQESKGLRIRLADSMRHCLVEYTPGLLEPGMEYSIDLQRIGNVVSKTVKGLLWNDTRLRLPKRYGIAVVPSINFEFLGPRLMALVAEVEARERNSASERVSIGNGAFEYWRTRISSKSNMNSVWLLRFYGGQYFVCFVVPKKEIRNGYFRRAIYEGLIAV